MYPDYFDAETYIYKKEVDWSLLNDGLTLPLDNQVIFGRKMGRFLRRGETKDVYLCLEGKNYKARIYNVNFDSRHNRKKDTLQIRYSPKSELSDALKVYFINSYRYIMEKRLMRKPDDRNLIKLPEDQKEYLAIYTTEYEDTYLIEPILIDEISMMRNMIHHSKERVVETALYYNMTDENAGFVLDERTSRIRKLNRKIGDNLKLLYNYRCQICGVNFAERYNSKIVEAHHIEYFVDSLNNDSSNQLIICPNHHSVIHDINPVFDKRKLIYTYPTGKKEGLVLNKHL